MTTFPDDSDLLFGRERMLNFMGHFKDNPDRAAKYTELCLLGRRASPLAWQGKGSYRRIAVTLTTRCNLKCLWCHRREQAVQDYIDRDMPASLALSLLPGLAGFSMLHWAGLGEPLLYEGLDKMTKAARQFVPAVKITTNATRLTRRNAEELERAGLTHVEVSIDGFEGEANERCRGVPLKNVLQGLRALSEHTSLPIQINSAISSLNYESLFPAVDVLRDVKNIVCLHTIPLFMTRFMVENDIAPVTSEQHQALIEHWRSRMEVYGLNWRLSPDTFGVTMDPVIALKRNCNLCFSVYEDPFINVHGNLAPCGRLQHVNLVDLERTSFDDAWNGLEFRAWRSAQLKGRYGRDCVRECFMTRTEGEDTP